MKKITIIFWIIIFFVGLSLLLYPLISNLINENRQLSIINNYEKNFENLENDEYEIILKNAQTYNTDLLNDYQATFDNLELYKKMLITQNSSIMGYIEIEKLKIKLPIYHGTDEQTLQTGIGHMRGSSLPIGGTGSHAVLFGHRGLPTSKLFSNLDKLVVGDMFSIQVLKEKIHYKVKEIVVIEPEKLTDYLKINKENDIVTLVTCTPYGINTHRLLIIAERTEKDSQIMNVTNIIDKDDQKMSTINVVMIIIVLIFVAIIVAVILIARYRNLGYIFRAGKKKNKYD